MHKTLVLDDPKLSLLYHELIEVSNIVVDTSVFISALIGAKGPSRELIRRCLLGEYQPLMGTALFSEYEAVMGRKEILARCSLEQAEIDSLLAAFMSVAEWTKSTILGNPISKMKAITPRRVDTIRIWYYLETHLGN